MRTLFIALVCVFLCTANAVAGTFWTPAAASSLPVKLQRQHPTKFIAYQLDETQLKNALFNVSSDPAQGIILSLPLPDGTFRNFRVWQQSIMPDALAARYPQIRTFTGEAEHNRTITIKADLTDYGFHAMIFDGHNTSFIDPYDLYSDGLYLVHYKRDEVKPLSERMTCATHADHVIEPTEPYNLVATDRRTGVTNGYKARSYRLALCADSWYCQAATSTASPTISQSLSAMTTSMNRINGVYEREFSVTMNFVVNEDALIWPTATGSANGSDPFYYMNSNGGSCITRNQVICDSIIGSANYDIGHVFTTAAGGITLDDGIVCNNLYKAQSATGQPTPVGDGFDINYVAHEMGHEFGADHTFNDNMTGSCGGNAVPTLAYEPGSGSTIMAYAGICYPDDIQANSDAYFHSVNLIQVSQFITGAGDVCAVRTPSLNLPVGIDSFSAIYAIPALTPFELTAPIAHDSTSDTSTTYCWDQWNLGDYGMTFVHTQNFGPIFRSISPVTYPSWRTFPRIEHVISGQLNDEGYEDNQGEKVPDSARYMTFRLALRDIYAGSGCFLFPADTVHIDVYNTAAGFTVSSQSTTGIVYNGGTNQTITWNNVGTPSPPYNTPDVDIYMSVDGAYHWMYHVGTFANTGSATVVVPNPPANVIHARFKVKGHDNVFFNINTSDFEVDYNTSASISAGVAQTPSVQAMKLYPVPAHDMLHIELPTGVFRTTILNTMGQIVWSGSVSGQADVPVGGFPAGVYSVLTVAENGAITTEPTMFIVN